MRSSIILPLMLLAWLGTLRAACSQHSPELSALYGRGVHSFFASQVSRAEQQFTKVIDAGSTDPRVYYFRSMARLRMGRMEEARSDMRIGASYEARRPGDRAAISKSLQRVQGSGRMMLERFRREARLVRGEQRRSQSRTRYQQLRQREADVLRQPVDLPLEQLIDGAPADVTKPPSTSEPATGMGDSSAPETAPVSALPGTSPAAIPRDQNLQSEPALPTDTSDPFDDGSPEPAVPVESEPAATPPPEPPVPAQRGLSAEDPFGQPEAPTDATDPFGDTAPAAAVPAESEPAATVQPESPVPAQPEPLAEDPFGQSEAPTDATDPFGDAAPAAAVPAESEPAATVQPESPVPAQPEPPAEDPFGQSETQADTSDPFGQPETPTDMSDPFAESLPPPSPAEAQAAGPTEGGVAETPQVDVFGEPVQSTSPTNKKAPVANSKGDQAAVGSKQGTSQKQDANKNPSTKSDQGTSASKATGEKAKGEKAKDEKATGEKAKGEKATTPTDSAADASATSDTDPAEKPAEPTDPEEDPFAAEDDPFGGF